MLMATAASCVVDLVAADPSVLLLHLHTDAIILALQTRFLRMEELRELARDERGRGWPYIYSAGRPLLPHEFISDDARTVSYSEMIDR